MNTKKTFGEELFNDITGMVVTVLLAIIMALAIAIAGPGTPGYDVLEKVEELYQTHKANEMLGPQEDAPSVVVDLPIRGD